MKVRVHLSARRQSGHQVASRLRCWLSVGLALMALASVRAQATNSLDTLFLVQGGNMVGRLIGLDDHIYRLEKPLPPPPNAPPGSSMVFATVTIPRTSVDYIVFAPNLERDNFLKTASVDDLAKVAGWWESAAPWLGISRSSAARVGLAYGDLLLRTGKLGQAKKALAVFRKIEAESWSPEDDMAAQQGRLRAMVATGRAQDAVEEAMDLAKISEDPAVLIEAKFVLASAADKQLRQLVKANPRWIEDVYVIPERNRLYHEALDLYLYPGLFAGSESEAAARGLWGAVSVYQFTEELPAAVELSRDLVTIYPDTKYAALAQKFLDSLPDDLIKHNSEQEARETLKETESPQPHEK